MNVGSIDSMVEVTLRNDEDFLKVKETLTRIGVASRKNRALYQSCHILHKQQKYYITPLNQTKIIPYKDKDQWDLIPKYNIGKKR